MGLRRACKQNTVSRTNSKAVKARRRTVGRAASQVLSPRRTASCRNLTSRDPTPNFAFIVSRSKLGRIRAIFALCALLSASAGGSMHSRADHDPEPGKITHPNPDRGHNFPAPHVLRHHSRVQMPACTICQFNQLSNRTLLPAPTTLDGLVWRLLSRSAEGAPAIAGFFRGISGRSPPQA